VAVVGHRNVNRRNESAAGQKIERWKRKTMEKDDYKRGYFSAFIQTGKK
jgi:hypothetical protein